MYTIRLYAHTHRSHTHSHLHRLFTMCAHTQVNTYSTFTTVLVHTHIQTRDCVSCILSFNIVFLHSLPTFYFLPLSHGFSSTLVPLTLLLSCCCCCCSYNLMSIFIAFLVFLFFPIPFPPVLYMTFLLNVLLCLPSVCVCLCFLRCTCVYVTVCV